MSEANQQAVRRCAALARIDVTALEIEAFSQDFERILEAFRDLTQLDVSKVPPMHAAAELTNILRADCERESLTPQDLLAPAPKVLDGFFSVPKTLGMPS